MFCKVKFLFTLTNSLLISSQLVNGHLLYISQLSSSPPINMTSDIFLSDGAWHSFTIDSHDRTLRLYLDGSRIGEELDAVGVHDFLDPYLTHLAVGGAKREWRSPDLFMQREYIIGRFMIFNWIVFFFFFGTD